MQPDFDPAEEKRLLDEWMALVEFDELPEGIPDVEYDDD